jgi:hypothetical protein
MSADVGSKKNTNTATNKHEIARNTKKRDNFIFPVF